MNPRLSPDGLRRRRPTTATISTYLCAALFVAVLLAPTLAAQDNRQEEIAATLSTGRVIFCVTKDSIVVAALPGGGEVGAHPPGVVALNSGRVGVVLGATDWSNGAAKPFRLDAELPAIASNSNSAPTPVTDAPIDPNRPTAIEGIGIALLEALRPQVTAIHSKLDLAPDEPMVVLLLADYVENYGPEIWELRYTVRQRDLGNGYWDTQPLRPGYNQLYPPEKGQPRTFMEISYPEDKTRPTLAALLQKGDPQLQRLASASKESTQAIDAFLKGDSRKAATAPVIDFLRGALPDPTDANALVLAKLDTDRGFQWILKPAAAPPPPTTKPREPEAPTLRRYEQPH